MTYANSTKKTAPTELNERKRFM